MTAWECILVYKAILFLYSNHIRSTDIYSKTFLSLDRLLGAQTTFKLGGFCVSLTYSLLCFHRLNVRYGSFVICSCFHWPVIWTFLSGVNCMRLLILLLLFHQISNSIQVSAISSLLGLTWLLMFFSWNLCLNKNLHVFMIAKLWVEQKLEQWPKFVEQMCHEPSKWSENALL